MTQTLRALAMRYCASFCLLLFAFTQGYSQQSASFLLGSKESLHDHWFGYNGQNVIRGASWVDTNLVDKIPLLKPSMFRFPSSFDYWDWKRGWFVDSPLLPEKFSILDRQPNYLENFQVVLDDCNAETIFTLNMVTATLQDQLDMLHHADSIGIPVKYIELGNEMYLAGNPKPGIEVNIVDSLYPTPESYALTANVWIDSIHAHFPSAKVAVDGCYEKFWPGRSLGWNDSIRPVLSGREDSWTFHVYPPSAWSDSTETQEDIEVQSTDEVPDWMFQPQKAYTILQESMKLMNPGKEVWITEYNLNDQIRPIQGMWAHGLFNASLTSWFLRDSRIKHVTCHAMNGGAIYGQYFVDSLGFESNPVDDPVVTVSDPPPSSPWELTASGHVMKMFAEAIDGSTDYCILDFDAPKTMIVENYGRDTFYLEGLQGVLFTKTGGSACFILNLTEKTYTLTTGNVYVSGGTYQMKYADPLTRVANDDSVEVKSGSLGLSRTLEPYSALLIQSSFVPGVAPSVQITVGEPSSVCAGDSVYLDAGAGYIAYRWSTGETTRSIWAKSGGDYWVNATTGLRAWAGSDTVHVDVHEPPAPLDVTRYGPAVFCEGSSTELAIVGSVPEGVSYSWNTGSTDSSLTVTEGGDYWVTYTDEFGCESQSEIKTITVNPLPEVSVTASGPTTFCDGGSVLLTAYPAGAIYKWSNQQSSQIITSDKSGSFSVTVTDANGCKALSAPVEVTEVVLPNPSITVTGATTYCEGATPTVLQTISGYSYQWKKGTASIAGATQISYTPTSTGTYKVTITDANGCTKTTTTGKTITINAKPTVSVSTTKTNICGSETALLTASGTTGVTYQWKKNGANISGATTATYTATKAATYACKVTKSSTGCTATSSDLVITANCRMDGSSGISANVVRIFPNPASDQLNVSAIIEAVANGPVNLQVQNLLGQVIMEQSVEIADGKLEMSLQLPETTDGMYLLSMLMQDRRVVTRFEIQGHR